MIYIKTGDMTVVDDSTEEGKKKYYEMALGNEWMEWFMYREGA